MHIILDLRQATYILAQMQLYGLVPVVLHNYMHSLIV